MKTAIPTSISAAATEERRLRTLWLSTGEGQIARANVTNRLRAQRVAGVILQGVATLAVEKIIGSSGRSWSVSTAITARDTNMSVHDMKHATRM